MKIDIITPYFDSKGNRLKVSEVSRTLVTGTLYDAKGQSRPYSILVADFDKKWSNPNDAS